MQLLTIAFAEIIEKKYFLTLKLVVAPVALTINDAISGYNLETFRDFRAANL